MTKLLTLFKKKRTVEERIKIIQRGNKEDREKLIKEYIPFITKALSTQLGRYIDKDNDDIFSIGLMAFNESIDKYDEDKGSFLSFASVVIRNRVIDQLRRESRQLSTTQLPVENGDEAGGDIGIVEGFESQIELKMDMATLVQRMKSYGVSLDDLIHDSPKHKNTRKTAILIGKHIYKQEKLKEKFIRTKTLPITELIKDLQITKKVIQGNRKFIIAVVLILDSNLDTLKGYLSENEGGEKDEI